MSRLRASFQKKRRIGEIGKQEVRSGSLQLLQGIPPGSYRCRTRINGPSGLNVQRCIADDPDIPSIPRPPQPLLDCGHRLPRNIVAMEVNIAEATDREVMKEPEVR